MYVKEFYYHEENYINGMYLSHAAVSQIVSPPVMKRRETCFVLESIGRTSHLTAAIIMLSVILGLSYIVCKFSSKSNKGSIKLPSEAPVNEAENLQETSELNPRSKRRPKIDKAQ